MTRPPKKPTVSEEDLLDLVEGRLPLERIEEITPALRADPDLAARVKAMARDREALAESAGASFLAPSGLLEGALERAEREALAESAAASAAPAPMLPKLVGMIAAGLAIALTAAFFAQTFIFAERGEDASSPVFTEFVEVGPDAPAETAIAIVDIEVREPLTEEIQTPVPAITLAEREAEPPTALDDDQLARAAQLSQEGTLVLVVESGDQAIPTGLLADAGVVRGTDGRVVVPMRALASSEFASAGLDTSETLSSGEYEVQLRNVRDREPIVEIVREMESLGVRVRVERADTPIARPLTIEDVLWWSPQSVDVPEPARAFRLVIENGQ